MTVRAGSSRVSTMADRAWACRPPVLEVGDDGIGCGSGLLETFRAVSRAEDPRRTGVVERHCWCPPSASCASSPSGWRSPRCRRADCGRCARGHDALARPALGFPFVDDRRLRVERVAVEHRREPAMSEKPRLPTVVPWVIWVTDRPTRGGQREHRVDQPLVERWLLVGPRRVRCSAWVFIVTVVDRTLSRLGDGPSGCVQRTPASGSSNHSPRWRTTFSSDPRAPTALSAERPCLYGDTLRHADKRGRSPASSQPHCRAMIISCTSMSFTDLPRILLSR